MRKEVLDATYQNFHLSNKKYGFAHHLTSKGAFFREKIGKNKKILDLGSRDGVMTLVFSSENQVTCIDVDSRALKKCQEVVKCDVLHHDLNEIIPLKSDTFDVVVLADVLEHVVLQEQLVAECYRLLRRGGVFLGSSPNAYYYSNRIKMLMGVDLVEYIDPMHVRHFSMNSLEKLLSAKFPKTKIIPYGHNFLNKIVPRIFASDFLWIARKDDYDESFILDG